MSFPHNHKQINKLTKDLTMKDFELLTLQLRQIISKVNMADKLSEKDALRFIETLHDIDQKLKGINHE